MVDTWPARPNNVWEHRVVWYGIVPTTGTIIGCAGKAYLKSLAYWDFPKDGSTPNFWRFAPPILLTERRLEEFERGVQSLERIHMKNLEAEQAGIVQYKIPIALSDHGKRPTVINFMVERYVHCYSYRIHVYKEYEDKTTGVPGLRQTSRIFAWRKPQCARAFAALHKLINTMYRLREEKRALSLRTLEEAPTLEKLNIADEVLADEINFVGDMGE